MGVEEYTKALEQGGRLNDTLIHKLFEGYVALGNALTDQQGVIDYSRLKDTQMREQAANTLFQVLIEYATERWGASISDEDDKKELAFLTFGLDLEVILGYIKERQENFNPMEFVGFAQQKTPFGYFLNRNAEGRAKVKLKEDDANQVVQYTKTEGRVNPEKLSIDEMAELLNEFIKEKTITESFLRGKKYVLK